MERDPRASSGKLEEREGTDTGGVAAGAVATPTDPLEALEVQV